MSLRDFGTAVRRRLTSIPTRTFRRGATTVQENRLTEQATTAPIEVVASDVVWPAEPFGHRDPAAVQQKLALLDEPHIKPLNDWVRALNVARAEAEEENIAPWFDPSSGGIYAKTLILLEAPGPRATSSRGSGIISIDNADQTARNMFMLTTEAGLKREDFVPWNVVPWYLPDGSRTRVTRTQDVQEAVPYIESLLDLFVSLERVITLGSHSKRGWEIVRRNLTPAASLDWDFAPHPSATNLNTRPEARQQILDCFQRAAQGK